VIDVGSVETSCRMLRRVGSASAPNVRSSEAYLGIWLTIRERLETLNSECRAEPEHASTAWRSAAIRSGKKERS
jgi:hypothetical protein